MPIDIAQAFSITHAWWKFYVRAGDYQLDWAGGMPIYELLGQEFAEIENDDTNDK